MCVSKNTDDVLEPCLDFIHTDEQVANSSSPQINQETLENIVKSQKNLFWDQDNLIAETLFHNKTWR